MLLKLTESNLMKHLLENIKDNIYFMDRDGRIVLINAEGAKWLGYDSPQELIGKTNLDIFTDEHGIAAFRDEQCIMETGIPILGKEEKETWADGHETWVSTSKMPLRDEDGDVVGTFGISRDITEHKKSELRAEKYAEENRKFREEMEEELLMASELQKTFFPTSYPVFPQDASGTEQVVEFNHLYHSSALVGGDFCSVRKLSGTEVGILLCDMMGHGVRAALGTAVIRGIVEEVSCQKKDPGQFLRHLNQVLMPILRKGDLFIYATAFYLVLDVRTGTLRYANAGHPNPILVNKNEARWLSDGSSACGPGLAIDADAEFRTCECTVHSGDSVILYTDGIYEVEGADKEDFGEDRLLAAAYHHRHFSLQDLYPALLESARNFSSDGEFDDDICLVGFTFLNLLAG